jgi:hypothetical protein
VCIIRCCHCLPSHSRSFFPLTDINFSDVLKSVSDGCVALELLQLSSRRAQVFGNIIARITNYHLLRYLLQG